MYFPYISITRKTIDYSSISIILSPVYVQSTQRTVHWRDDVDTDDMGFPYIFTVSTTKINWSADRTQLRLASDNCGFISAWTITKSDCLSTITRFLPNFLRCCIWSFINIKVTSLLWFKRLLQGEVIKKY